MTTHDVPLWPHEGSGSPLAGQVVQPLRGGRWYWRCTRCGLTSVCQPRSVAFYKHEGTAAHWLRKHDDVCKARQ
jgi:hypothetical protein